MFDVLAVAGIVLMGTVVEQIDQWKGSWSFPFPHSNRKLNGRFPLKV
jgi:hypothetical protein